ncbi:MAG: isoaspartyl peptidase/L-asparaginase family protein, partial [Gemmatimonadota bacterium]
PVLLVFALACAPGDSAVDAPAVEPDATIEWGLVMHGGAGTITPDNMTPELEAEYREKLAEAMGAGHAVLAGDGSSLDAVVAAITVLEDSPLFNAGRGAVFTAQGTNEMDASIMDGATLQAGAVAGVTTVKNPIGLARLVMEASPHVLLAGAGAEEFGRLQGVEMVDPEYFRTERRWRQLLRAQEAESEAGDPGPGAGPGAGPASPAMGPERKFGTVGVVALDRAGGLAAGTSTGGTTNKKWGRIGDSPVIGAGTYAGGGCGVSSTGTGEYFIRNVVAYDICARVKYEGVTLAQAAHAVVMERLEDQEPELGGIIALDADGNVVMTFNTAGMYRGYIGPDGRAVTAIYR